MKRVAFVLIPLAVIAAGGATLARAIQYHGTAKPGVHVLGFDVGGDDRATIMRKLDSWSSGRVTILAGPHAYHVRRDWLVKIDVAGTASRVLAAGSPVSLVVSTRVDVQPKLGNSPGTDVLQQIALAGSPPVSPEVKLDGVDVTVTPGRNGRTLDRARLLDRLAAGEKVVRAPFRAVRPPRSNRSAEGVAAAARKLLSAPVSIDYVGVSRGTFTPEQLARAMRIDPTPHRFSIHFDGDRLYRVLHPRFADLVVRARNARFVVSGDNVGILPSHTGLDLRPAQLANAFAAAASGDRVAHVRLLPRQPDRTTADAKALGIRQKLVSYTTEMGVSSSNRIHNVHLMADFIDGTLIQPGATFSFNDVVGPRTADRGFLEGQEIIGSLVLPSIGGGVCQTATTLFNDAFELGLPILQRTNHNLYLSHYPIGRDATVSWGGPDFVFRNDMKHGLLIKTSYTDQTLTFTFYGTPEGRRVVSHTSPQTNWTKPSMNYAVDPNAPPKSVRVVAGTGELGFDVTVTRDVYDSRGRLLRHNVFHSHYIPDSPTTVYGPGRTPAGPYIVLPTSI